MAYHHRKLTISPNLRSWEENWSQELTGCEKYTKGIFCSRVFILRLAILGRDLAVLAHHPGT
jgi:hypothetical protein